LHKTIISAQTIAASGTFVSERVVLGDRHRKQSIYYVITGDGTATIEYEASPDGINFVLMATAVAEAKTKITGEQSDGVHFDELAMVPCEVVRFKITETSTTNSITITAVLCFRLWD
jgi:hypothetical protein